jgi:hypothetical protein
VKPDHLASVALSHITAGGALLAALCIAASQALPYLLT